MQSIRVFFIIFISVLLSSPVLAQEKNLPKSSKRFADVQSFGYIMATVQGDDAIKIGLFESELTDYVRLLFKNNFAGIKYTDPLSFKNSDQQTKKVGFLWFRIWIVGDDYPIAYYVEGKMGSIDLSRFPLGTSFKNWSRTFINKNVKELELNEVLGYGSKTDVKDTIKETLKKMIEDFAIDFSKARDET